MLENQVMVVCIDGPLRGRLCATDGGKSYLHPHKQEPVSLGSSSPFDVTFDTMTYHVHTISFLGFGIRVASLHLTPSKIDPYDVVSVLFNEVARQATYRVNVPT